MELDPNSLTASILAVFKSKPKAGAIAARDLARAYQSYAALAQAGTALPLFTGTENQGLEQALLTAMNPVSGTAASMANAWGAGINAFWLASPAPVVFSDTVNTGPVPAVPGVPALISTLTGVFSNPRNLEQTAAFQIASALDVVTRTITLVLQPSGVPVTVF